MPEMPVNRYLSVSFSNVLIVIVIIGGFSPNFNNIISKFSSRLSRNRQILSLKILNITFLGNCKPERERKINIQDSVQSYDLQGFYQ